MQLLHNLLISLNMHNCITCVP